LACLLPADCGFPAAANEKDDIKNKNAKRRNNTLPCLKIKIARGHRRREYQKIEASTLAQADAAKNCRE
jgi:hypothetical protein